MDNIASQRHLPFGTFLSPTFAGASDLVGLSKPNEDVRPVAIGEVLPRILAYALCVLLHPEMETYLARCNQLGIDISNAFNLFHRHAMFNGLRDSSFTNLIPFLCVFYGVPIGLYLRTGPFVQMLASERGLRQGDPFSPFLFTFTRQLVMAPTMKDLPYLLFLSYMDDTYVLGPQERVLAAYDVLQE
ncbi:unnamed protein product [Closterium sp. NIES-53]